MDRTSMTFTQRVAVIAFLTSFAGGGIAVGCGGDDSSSSVDGGSGSDGGGGEAGIATTLGSGTIAPGDFTVRDVVWSDAGPFNGHQRVDVVLANDDACHRTASCPAYEELTLRFTPDVGGLVAGTYVTSRSGDAGDDAAGFVTATRSYVRGTGNDCSTGANAHPEGSATIERVNDTEVVGTFTFETASGSFDAVGCP